MLGIHPNKYIYIYILILLSWEAVDNVGNVMTNLLRVQSKMENLRGKLAALEKSDEQEQIHSWYLYRHAFQIQYRVLNQHPKWRTTPSVHKTPAFAIYIHHIYVKFLYKEEFCEVSEGFSTTYLFCFQPQVCQSYQPFNLGASKRWRDSASSCWLITMNLLILSPTLMVRAMMNLIVRIFFSNYTWSMFPFSVVHFQTHDYPSSPQES